MFPSVLTPIPILVASEGALAQGVSSTSSGTGGGNTIGDVLMNVFLNVKPIELFILSVCFLLGVYLLGTGLLSAARAVSDRQRGFGDAARRVGLAAFMAAIPNALGVGFGTLWGKATLGFYGFNPPGVGAPANCLQSFAEGGGLACVARNVATNIAPIATFVAVVLAFLGGLAILGKAIYDLALAKAEGRPANTQGMATRIVVGVLLANLPLVAGSMLATVGAPIFSGLSQTGYIIHSQMVYVPDGGGLIAQNFNSLMNSLFVILVMFGTLAIIRGLVIVKQVSENRVNGRTMGSAVTHLVAGVLMMNMNWTICTVARTFIGNVPALGFCPV